MKINNKPLDKLTSKLLDIAAKYYDKNGDYEMDILTNEGNYITIILKESSEFIIKNKILH